MVTISNGISTYRVTLGAAKLYKTMGFHIVEEQDVSDVREQENYIPGGADSSDSVQDGDASDTQHRDDKPNEDDGATEDGFIEELLEKPLSMWTSDEMKKFVVVKGIDTSKAQKVSQVRAIIKAYLEEQKKSA